jgi:hypothetical protein
MSVRQYETKAVQGSEFKKRSSKFLPCSNSESEIHSSAVCACATLPGPKTTLGIPPADKIAASQKKWTPSGFVRPMPFKNFWTSGSLKLVSNGNAGASFALEIFEDNFLARSSAEISRRTPASVSPGNVRRSIEILQQSGTIFG